jgi:hypothetical protein
MEAEYFLPEGWTGDGGLISFTKIDFWRRNHFACVQGFRTVAATNAAHRPSHNLLISVQNIQQGALFKSGKAPQGAGRQETRGLATGHFAEYSPLVFKTK